MNSEPLLKLSHYGLLRVTGSESESFLQRQITNDIGVATANRICPSAYLTPTGRVLANFLVIRRDEGFVLICSVSIADSLAARLKMYVMRSDVAIEAATDLAAAGIQSGVANQATECLNIPQWPAIPGDVVSVDLWSLIRMPGESARTLLIGPASRLGQLDPAPDIRRRWELFDIRAGQPLIHQDTAELFTAQAVNLDLTDSVSFTKGCFPGQEILARLHYRGRTNRRTVRGLADSAADLAPGAAITCDALAGAQEGTVVNAAPSDSTDGYEILASVPLKFLNNHPLTINNSCQMEIIPDGLPYALPELS